MPKGGRWSAAGVGWIEPPRALETLEQLIVEGHAQAGVLPIDWRKFFERIPAGSEPAWLLDIAREARAADSPGESGPPVLLEKLQSVTPARAAGSGLDLHPAAGGGGCWRWTTRIFPIPAGP